MPVGRWRIGVVAAAFVMKKASFPVNARAARTMVNGSEGHEGLEGDGIVAAAALEEHME